MGAALRAAAAGGRRARAAREEFKGGLTPPAAAAAAPAAVAVGRACDLAGRVHIRAYSYLSIGPPRASRTAAGAGLPPSNGLRACGARAIGRQYLVGLKPLQWLQPPARSVVWALVPAASDAEACGGGAQSESPRARSSTDAVLSSTREYP